jgi:hypothetical protein
MEGLDSIHEVKHGHAHTHSDHDMDMGMGNMGMDDWDQQNTDLYTYAELFTTSLQEDEASAPLHTSSAHTAPAFVDVEAEERDFVLTSRQYLEAEETIRQVHIVCVCVCVCVCMCV